MLIISREFVEQSGGDPTNLRLCGQVNDTSAWSICKLNMLLHGITGADIAPPADTLLHPMHREAGELERFDRVIANPPFSQNYTRTNMEFPERFRWGWAPTKGKKGDLMFAQHMLAVCKPGGVVTTVMPHGVLFRGGAEKEIRKKFLEQDLIEAIIGLPQNLFYGASIPACILVMHPNLTGRSPNPNKPADRRGQILFINADAEFHAGRAQNYLRPEHVEKIVSTFNRYQDIPGYARIVPLSEIAGEANDFNLNIRRYVDNSPPPEPHDVRAHLLGGVPVAEVADKNSLFDALGFDALRAFAKRERDATYYDFSSALPDRAAISSVIEGDPDVQARLEKMRDQLAAWWLEHSPRLADLPQRRDLNRVRSEFLDTFVTALLPLNTLDRFKLAGVIATWWTETLADFKTLLENGFPGVIDGWSDCAHCAISSANSARPWPRSWMAALIPTRCPSRPGSPARKLTSRICGTRRSRRRSCRLRTNCITSAPSLWITGPSATNCGAGSTVAKKAPFGITPPSSKLFPLANGSLLFSQSSIARSQPSKLSPITAVA
jgi:type I restriction enzyme M protein